jgi:tetratricopeptide (TPR) repeat protein
MSSSAREWFRRGQRARADRRFAEARHALREALSASDAQPEEASFRIGVLRTLAEVERGEGHPEIALSLYEEAVALCRTSATRLVLAHTIRHLGDVYRHLERLADAEPMYLEALELYRSDPETAVLDLANAVRPFAILTQLTGRLDESRRLWLEAKSLYTVAGIADGVAESEEHLRELSR